MVAEGKAGMVALPTGVRVCPPTGRTRCAKLPWASAGCCRGESGETRKGEIARLGMEVTYVWVPVRPYTQVGFRMGC
eukprot:scaffold81166_cov24-Tisochrysis_lutea.AAC.1